MVFKIILTLTALLCAVSTVHGQCGSCPFQFAVPVIFDGNVATYGETDINNPTFQSVAVDYSAANTGSADPLPANPSGYAIIQLNGNDQAFPYWDVNTLTARQPVQRQKHHQLTQPQEPQEHDKPTPHHQLTQPQEPQEHDKPTPHHQPTQHQEPMRARVLTEPSTRKAAHRPLHTHVEAEIKNVAEP